MAETKLDPKQDPSKEASKLSVKDLLAQQKALGERSLAMGPHALDDVLEHTAARAQDQRQEQQLYASTWGGAAGVVAALIKVADLENDISRRKALEAMQAEMFELLAKEKKRDALRNSPFFRQLVSILGHDTAENITQKLEAAGASSASGLQANQAALAQASKDIATLLDKNQAVLGLKVGGAPLAAIVEGEIANAIGRIPRSTHQLSLVKPEDVLATKAHETMKGLDRGDERLARLQALRSELGTEKFTAMLDAYDRKYGIPLVAHIANLSTSNPSFQAEMMRETLALLNLPQQERLIEFGRAEYAQTMALLDKQREAAKDSLRATTTEIRATEKILATTLGRPELGYLPEGAFRGKVLEELVKRFPELAGKSWEEVYLTLKDVAGKSDPSALRDALSALLGGGDIADPEALREFIARTTLQMQKLTALDSQVEVFAKILSTSETGDEAKLREHYSLAYGTEATRHDKHYDGLKKVAESHIDNLHRRISDPTLGTEERAKLIKERDALEFACVKKLTVQALYGKDGPDTQGALAILKNFAVSYADTPARRSEAYRGVCEKLIASIESADTLRREWQGLDVGQFANVEFKKTTGREVVSCIDGRPARMDDIRLGERLAAINGSKGDYAKSGDALDKFIASGAPIGKSRPVTKETQLEVLKAQRNAAISTDFFGHILEGSAHYKPSEAPLAKVDDTFATSNGKRALESIATATATLDEASAKLHKELIALEAAPRNSFLAVDSQRALLSGLSEGVCEKLKVRSAAEAVFQVIRELDPVHDIPVDRSVLDTIRSVVPSDSEIGKAFASVRPGQTHSTAEYEAIKSSLDPVNALRLDLLAARETDAVAQGNPSIAASIVKEVLALDPKDLFAATTEAKSHARISRVERLLGALTEEEHQEFLRFFEMTTRRSVGEGLIATIPSDDSRSELLLRLAGTRAVTGSDLQRFYTEPVPSDRTARVAVLSRILQSDAQRPAVKVDEVRQIAQQTAYAYLNLRGAAQAAMRQGDVALAGEITEKLRSLEARMSGTITKTVSSLDASFVARSGLRDNLLALHEEIILEEGEKKVPGRPNLAELAKETSELLRSAAPKTEAALNRIRQANLTEEESLLLRALYTAESKHPSPKLEQRALTGDLRRDLEPLARPSAEEVERIRYLVKGGSEGLREFDTRSLAIAEREQNEKRQLEALSNLRASGRYDQMKDQVGAMKLTPAAKEYHEAVTSGDTKKADAADLSVKAKNGDVKPQEVAAFLKDKSPEDLARITKDHPNLAQDLHKASPFLTERQMAQLLSKDAAERQRAIEQAMLNSLKDPNDFAAWLDVHGTAEEKRERIRNLEKLVAHQSDAPTFLANGESKIVQYVRAQRTDFREIDAHLIGTIISSHLGEKQALDAGTIQSLLKLRKEGAVRMSTLDAFEHPRRSVYNAAQENLLQKAKYYAEAQQDQDRRWHFTSGHKYDAAISLTKARMNEQQALVRPMERGIRDIETSRELVRYAFALMAKDTIEKADKGLRPDTTDNVTNLLMRRDQAIQYKVTDHKRDAEWIACVKATSESIQSFDRWTSIGLGTAKVVTTVAAGIFFSPAAGLAVATAWNAGDKIYRATVCKESVSSLAKSFALELAIDTAFAALSAVKTTTITLAGGGAVKNTAAEGLKITKRVWEWKPFKSILTPHSLTEMSGKLVHSSMVPRIIAGEKVSERAAEDALIAKLGTKFFTQLAETIPDDLLRTNWAQFQTGRFVPIIVPSPVPSTSQDTTPKVEKPIEEKLPAPKVVEDGSNGSSAGTKGGVDAENVAKVHQVAKDPAPSAPATPPQQTVEITLSINPGLLNEIEAKLAISPNLGVQQAFDNITALMKQDVVSTAKTGLAELAAALRAWSPYPELAAALDEILTRKNPFLEFLNAPSTGYSAPPGQPPGNPPPAQPPPKDPPPKGPSSGGGGGSGLGPVLVDTPIPRDGTQLRGRSDGNGEERPITVPDLNTISLSAASSRVGLQGAAMQEALQRAASNPVQEPRSIPQPLMQQVASASPVSTPQMIAIAEQTAQRASVPRINAAELRMERRLEESRAETAAQTELSARPVANKQRAVGEQHEVHVALREESAKKRADTHDHTEATRIAESTKEREPVAMKDTQSKGAASREKEIETSLAKESAKQVAIAAKSSSETSKQVPVSEPEATSSDDANIKRHEARSLSEASTTSPLDDRRFAVIVERKGAAEVSAPLATPISHIAENQTVRAHAARTNANPAALTQHEAVRISDNGIAHTETETDPESLDDSSIIDGSMQSRKSTAKPQRGNDARMRQLLLQQLMDQHTTKARREKILKALIALGISEVEYRRLLLKLGEMDATRLAEQVAARTKLAEPLAMTTDAPEMKDSPQAEQVATTPSEPSKAQTTRAALYKRLKEEATAARK